MAVGFLSICEKSKIPRGFCNTVSLLKENINFWEEDLTSENQVCVTVTEDIFGTGTREIVESVLDENNAEVTTWYVAKKFIKRSKCESCKILLKVGDNDIAHDS